jgi:hypothetical protein
MEPAGVQQAPQQQLSALERVLAAGLLPLADSQQHQPAEQALALEQLQLLERSASSSSEGCMLPISPPDTPMSCITPTPSEEPSWALSMRSSQAYGVRASMSRIPAPPKAPVAVAPSQPKATPVRPSKPSAAVERQLAGRALRPSGSLGSRQQPLDQATWSFSPLKPSPVRRSKSSGVRASHQSSGVRASHQLRAAVPEAPVATPLKVGGWVVPLKMANCLSAPARLVCFPCGGAEFGTAKRDLFEEPHASSPCLVVCLI